MAFRSASHEAHEEQKFELSENLRGAMIVVAGSVALIGLAWGAMTVLTSPDGWVTKAANTAVSGDTQLVSFANGGAE
jgi:hypothetical protein